MIQQKALDNRLNAHEVLERVRPLGHPVLLDSSQPEAITGRYDIITAGPDRVVSMSAAGLSCRDSNGQPLQLDPSQPPFACLQQLLDELGTPEPLSDSPFNAGLMGIFGYDLGRAIEQLPEHAQADIDYPWLLVGRYLWAVIIDHVDNSCRLIWHPLANDVIDQVKSLLVSPACNDNSDSDTFALTQPFASNLSADQYRQALEKIDDYIHAGDCYQINFAQRFQAQYQGDPWHAYKRLRRQATTPHAAFMESPEGAILSLSPERFLFVDNDGQVETRPIKGTRPRGKTTEEDAALAQELSTAEKDRAENLMIVDLLRNDISRNCAPGSVDVPELFSIESYPNVHHLVSSVCGTLKPGTTALNLLRDAFPGGSITGAPKIRAMEIIDELEPQRRSVYCGSIGYISCCGRMDTSITIRTLLCQEGEIYCWAGGGIVADSVIEEEYQETFNKVNNLLQGLGT